MLAKIFVIVVGIIIGTEGYKSPRIGQTWQIQLQDTVDTSRNVDVFDIDVFDVPKETIDYLHSLGRTIICYFSAGSHEDWRSDAESFPPEVLGNNLDGWPGERWLDIRNVDVLGPIMAARMDLAVLKGCDGVDPDNVNSYSNESGFPLTAEDQIIYNTFLATAAHQRNLSIGLKNDLEQINELVGIFDFAINEQCFLFSECDLLLPFIQANKSVASIEYSFTVAEVCPTANAIGFSTILKAMDLKALPLTNCRDYVSGTATPSRIPTPSRSPSTSRTSSRAPSRSPTPSRTISRSPSPSRTISRSQSPSRTISRSRSPSRTISRSPSPTRTTSRSSSRSKSPSRSPSKKSTSQITPSPSRI